MHINIYVYIFFIKILPPWGVEKQQPLGGYADDYNHCLGEETESPRYIV